ncbi:AAA domain-containing protein [Streptomyces sp. NPDC088747]|uniref:AAA domain-containing protein n=1 Tax=Streptomyces sp. NPDC088747 TaxID=3365886 RepID=UPI0038294498
MTQPPIPPAELANAAVTDILTALTSGTTQPLVVDSPPGAGKSTLVVRAARTLAAAGERCIIVAQTNHQVDDLLISLADPAAPQLRLGRLTGGTYEVPEDVLTLPGTIISKDIKDVLSCDVIIATAMKWAYVDGPHWQWAIIDEAYQMRSDALLLIAKLFDRALLVGDPGQLDPFSIVSTPRWTGLPHDPLNNAVTVLTNHNDATLHTLPVSWRLPPSAAGIVSRAFYPFTPFHPGTAPAARTLTLTTQGLHDRCDATVEEAARAGWALHELPPRHTGRIDAEAAHATVALASRLLTRGADAVCEKHPGGRRLKPTDIAIGTAHREQARHIQQLINHTPHARGVRADTANRLQGREFAVTIILHPLSGRRDASAFHLEAGRLCVLASRHRHACIMVARAGITDLLDRHPSNDPVPLHVPAKFPDGWEAHQHVLDHLSQHRVPAA